MQRVPPIFIGLAISGALAVLGVAGYVLMFSYVRAEGAKLAALEQELTHATQKESVLKSVKTIVTDTALDRATLERSFIGKEGIVPFLELVEGAGERAGVKTQVTSVSIERDAGKDVSFERLRVSVTGEGSFSQVLAFFVIVEGLPFGVHTEGANISEKAWPDAAGWRGTFTFTAPKLL